MSIKNQIANAIADKLHKECETVKINENGYNCMLSFDITVDWLEAHDPRYYITFLNEDGDYINVKGAALCESDVIDICSKAIDLVGIEQ